VTPSPSAIVVTLSTYNAEGASTCTKETGAQFIVSENVEVFVSGISDTTPIYEWEYVSGITMQIETVGGGFLVNFRANVPCGESRVGVYRVKVINPNNFAEAYSPNVTITLNNIEV
jgi:hypothetical protein